MTISLQRRQQDANSLLRMMYNAVELDQHYDAIFFKTDDRRFAAIAPTTWRELLSAGFIKAVDVRRSTYRLTGRGWIEGMKVADQTRLVRTRSSKLVAAVKKRVDRRSHLDEIVSVEDLAKETKTSVGWCFNAINSGLLSHLFPGKQMDTTMDYPLVHIPPTFGHARR